MADLLDTGHGDGDNEPSDLQRPPNPDLSFQLLQSASNRVTVPSPKVPSILGTIRFGLNSHFSTTIVGFAMDIAVVFLDLCLL